MAMRDPAARCGAAARANMRDFELEHAPYRLSGTVVAALLNHEEDWLALGARAHEAPHKAPPRLPVLGVRPPTTLAASGESWVVPRGVEGVVTGATLGIVIGRPACRIGVELAGSAIAGYLVVNDGSLPLPSHYRPALRQRVRDRLCVLGHHAYVPATAVADPAALEVQVRLDGRLEQRCDTGRRVRDVARLLCDVSTFMTLLPGDVLLLGAAPGAPLARPGQRVTVSIAGIGDTQTVVVAEGPA